MQVPQLPEDEIERLLTLGDLEELDTALIYPELDRITRLAAKHFNVPIALVSTVERDRQHFRSKVGWDIAGTARDVSFCAHAILEYGPTIVPDAFADQRFTDNPLVVGAPHIRFYVGQPIRSRQGHALGTLCLIDTTPRAFDDSEVVALQDFAFLVEGYLHGLEALRQTKQVERDLYRSEALFQNTFSQAAVGMALVAPSGEWLRVNQKLCEITGYDAATLSTKTFQDITHPEDLDTDLALVQQVIRGEISTYTLEKRYVRADGELTWVELTVSLMRNDAGQPYQFISVIKDINARKQAQQALAQLSNELEQRVAYRTQEMQVVIAQLNHQIERRVEIQRALANEKERFRATLENATDAFIEVDEQGLVVAWNRAAELTFGWTRQESMGKELSALLVPDRLQRAHRAGFERFLLTGESTMMGRRIEITARRKSGEEFPVELSLSESRVGDTRLIDAFLHDISQRKAHERAVLESQARLRMVTDNLPVLIAYVGADLRYQFNNRTYEDWFGYVSEKMTGTLLEAFHSQEEYQSIRPNIDSVMTGKRVSFEHRLDGIQGQLRLHTTFVPSLSPTNVVEGFFILAHDITERKRLEEKLIHEATHDALTGLPNRRAFMRKLEEAVARSQRSQQGIALLFLDLDGFKLLNDVHGHELGDKVLQRFAHLLRATVRQTDTVARLAGDEFIVILEGLDTPERGGARVAEKILNALTTVQTIEGTPVQLSASIGITTAFGPAEADKLLAKADAAMYRAKAAGKGRSAEN